MILLSITIGLAVICIAPHPQSVDRETASSSTLKAAIVDQLSLTAPNQTFVDAATRMLEQAKFDVDYYSGEKVTVEFYRELPTHNYSIIVMRVHSALRRGAQPPAALFTCEPYSQHRYVYEQLAEQLTRVSYNDFLDKEQVCFGIVPDFVRSCMKGRFQNSIIIVMGCNGLTYTEMASAFVEKGAKAYISWNSAITTFHTDRATIELLKNLITKKLTIKQAVTNTMKLIEDNPLRRVLKRLIAFPEEAWNYTIPAIVNSSS